MKNHEANKCYELFLVQNSHLNDYDNDYGDVNFNQHLVQKKINEPSSETNAEADEAIHENYFQFFYFTLN